jgi:hypothetical protein
MHSLSYAGVQLLSLLTLMLGQGTNIYNLLMHSEYSEESIRGTLLEQWANGIKVLKLLQSSALGIMYVALLCTNIRLRGTTPAARPSMPYMNPDVCHRWCEPSGFTMGTTMASSHRFRILSACFMR